MKNAASNEKIAISEEIAYKGTLWSGSRIVTRCRGYRICLFMLYDEGLETLGEDDLHDHDSNYSTL